mmetsp:Transcript_25871/g.102025  ORF Transcript_25871/g.102025 Transcript_25871/m.102025 type:complete len:93 (-) Transcript_25871:299-577(-)
MDQMSELHSMGVEMHLFTNYPVWWKMVEEELCLSQYAEWSFISCQMHTRKPEPKAFLLAADRLGCMPSDCESPIPKNIVLTHLPKCGASNGN